MAGQQAAAADAELGVVRGGDDTIDEVNAGPYAAGILPAAAGTAEPFAQDGASGHEAALLFVQSAGERSQLAGSAHTSGNQAGKRSEERRVGEECRSRWAP